MIALCFTIDLFKPNRKTLELEDGDGKNIISVIILIKMENKLSPTKSYLLGLITGRGHFFDNSKIIAIEFSHANEYAYGIAHCQNCGDLATKKEDKIICKKCGSNVDPKSRSVYNQPELTIESLKSDIIPFLNSEFPVGYDIAGNRSMTILVMDFKSKPEVFNDIKSFFIKATSYDNFHIPKEMSLASKEAKVEYINGLLDTAGFASPGGWLPRDGKNLHGRMRVYFQFVRNWHLPVETDNFLRKEFSLPVHTIDWGHPNIRDSGLEDFFNSRPTTWSREHQLKFFPEYYNIFKFRIKSKQGLFQELSAHNIKADFSNKEDWFPPREIPMSQIKAYHPGESDLRIPEPARHHVNAFWQVNLAMGCSYLQDLINKAKNPKLLAIAGKDDNTKVSLIEKEFDEISKKLTKEIFDANAKKIKKVKVLTARIAKEVQLEKNLYNPLSLHLEKYLTNKYKEAVRVFDSSSSNLNLFLKNKDVELFEMFNFCDKFRIKPDIVGFLIKSKRLVFEEAKITQLDLKSLGQLLGYCFVAQPEEAILISSKTPSLSLIKILKARPDLIEYGNNKKIQIGQWKKGKLEIINI